MIESLTFWTPIIAAISLIPIHELGHYFAAWRYGWKPQLKFVMHNYMPTFAVYATNTHFKINSAQDFRKVYIRLSVFSAMGLFFPAVAITIYCGLGVLDLRLAYAFMLFFVFYGIIEITEPGVGDDRGK